MEKNQMYAIAAVVVLIAGGAGAYYVLSDKGGDPDSMTDAAGNLITIPDTVTSITAASPSIADLVCYMEYGTKIVCVSNYCDNPGIPANVTICGSYTTPDTDAISAADATVTLVDASGSGVPAAYETLRASGMNVVMMYGSDDGQDGVYKNVEIVGFIMKNLSAAEEAIDQMKSTMSALASATSDASETTVLISTGLGNLATDGSGNFTDLAGFTGSGVYLAGASSTLCDLAGAVSNMSTPATGSGWTGADTDFISTSTGDVDMLIVLWTNKASMPNSSAIDALIERMKQTAWENCGAVQSENIVFIGGSAGGNLSRVTPYTIDVLPILSLYINPECYSETSGGAALSFGGLPATVDNSNTAALKGYTQNRPV